MCGIAGIVAFNEGERPTPQQLRTMCSTIRHRGPDDEGISVSDTVGLGMRRLSVIDIAGGQQPLRNEDGTVEAIFNGEIYNYRDLRRDLLKSGHRFSSETDGEVLVHLWEEHGPDLTRFLNGMYAIAIHDHRQHRLVLVRDRLGIKPLYYARSAGHLVFGSEIKAILASGLVGRELDLERLGEFMAWEYVPAPGTLLRSVRKLGAAELMDVDLSNGKTEIHSYWDVATSGSAGDGDGTARRPEDWAREVDDKIAQCVGRQLVSDVPLGAFLSGGVDSSLVVAAMGPAETFSIGFDDPSYNESAWSQAVAGHLGVRHECEIIRPNVVELFDHLMDFMDDPIGDFSVFPTYLVSRLARKHVTVVLSGDGGDELFGGYETYVAQQRSRAWKSLPRPLRERLIEPLVSALAPRRRKKGIVNKAKRFVEGVGYEPSLGHARWRLFVGDALRRSLFTAEALEKMGDSSFQHILGLFDRAGHRSEIDRCLYVDLKSYLADNCLVKVDRMSMACSLEARVPLLDHELVDLAFQVPSELKIHGNQTKPLLKRVAAGHIPRRCVYRPKEGFSIPMKSWIGTQFRPLMEELLHPDRLKDDGIFQAETVERLKRQHLAGRENNSHVLWSLMVFQDWRRRWSA